MGFLIKSKKLVTASPLGTVNGGALLVEGEIITALASWQELAHLRSPHTLLDYSDCVVTPSLIDCHTHLLEYAPPTILKTTEETHTQGAIELCRRALTAGVTHLGEHICGNPFYHLHEQRIQEVTAALPMDLSFAAAAIAIGGKEVSYFSGVTGTRQLARRELREQKLHEAVANASSFPGENIFINATPANLPLSEAPHAGALIFSQEELAAIASTFHNKGKRLGAHVAGAMALNLALDAGIDVLHHAHGLTKALISKAAAKRCSIVATPVGGSHLPPNQASEIVLCHEAGITVAIASDGYLPPHCATHGDYPGTQQLGPDSLMLIAQPAMKLMLARGHDENDALALITLNPARVLGKAKQCGSLQVGKEANFLVADGVPGLDITAANAIKTVYFRGQPVRFSRT